ncbi:MAG: xanthine dehydrogenase family protein subunit M [Planctomycetes bacterium]|nr:xanthine dehydrogenase family protein subunit M [Planctomycetota bacterium]
MFHQPITIEEALNLRNELGADATVINGGTDVVVAMNHGALKPQCFIDLSRLTSLRKNREDDGSLILGAGTTFAMMGRSHLRALREASLSVGGPAIRNVGTLGGNIATASPAGDGCVALLAMNADVQLTSAERGERWIPLVDFFIDYRKTALAGDELITAVRVPKDPQSRWYKIGKRGAVNISLVCCAVSRNANGKIGLAFGCVGPMPITTPKAASLLNGDPLTPELIDDVANLVAQEVRPIDDHRGSATYRRAMCKTLVKRLLTDLHAGDQKGDADA